MLPTLHRSKISHPGPHSDCNCSEVEDAPDLRPVHRVDMSLEPGGGKGLLKGRLQTSGADTPVILFLVGMLDGD